MGAGCLTAIVGGLHCCWAVNVIRWVVAVVCHSLSSVYVVVIFWVAGFVCGQGCMTGQQATWRTHVLSLMLVTWACGCHVSVSGSCCGLWVTRDVHGGGCYE